MGGCNSLKYFHVVFLTTGDFFLIARYEHTALIHHKLHECLLVDAYIFGIVPLDVFERIEVVYDLFPFTEGVYKSDKFYKLSIPLNIIRYFHRYGFKRIFGKKLTYGVDYEPVFGITLNFAKRLHIPFDKTSIGKERHADSPPTQAYSENKPHIIEGVSYTVPLGTFVSYSLAWQAPC